jgi:methylated-DNA-[protein]-cysteine S-methyltransferase
MTPETPLERSLRAGAAVSAADAVRPARDLAERADREGLVEVAYGRLDTPMGEMLVLGTDRGLARVVLPTEDPPAALERAAARLSPRLLELPRRVDAARRELDEYFSGRRRQFDLELDRSLIRGAFTESVLQAVAGVPFGEAITYAEAAARAGRPRAHRAAGNALGANPIPIVIPCHRVVRVGNVLGGYGGGPEMKRFLLEHEGWLDT